MRTTHGSRSRWRILPGLGVAAGLAFTSEPRAWAASAKPVIALAQASGGQNALAVGFDERAVLRAKVCPRVPCTLADGEKLELPAQAQKLVSKARLAVVPLGQGRHAIHVEIADEAQRRSWQAVVVAPLGGTKPQIVFQGWTGLVSGEEGTRQGPIVLVSDKDGGGRRIVIGEQREELSLCGRPAVLAPKLLNSADLKLYPAKVQRLTPGERERARQVVAERMGDAGEARSFPLLRAVAASSAVGSPDALTDGNVETTWAENRGGAGRGEFVLMNAPSQLPLVAVTLVVRPLTRVPEHGVAPREFWLVSANDIVHVTMPEDAWKLPGTRFRVPLDPPLRGDCLALVTESGFGDGKTTRVTFAELSAQTEFDNSGLSGLVGALAGGGPRAEAAGDVLGTLGQPAFEAVAATFSRLDEGGRRIALNVMDHAPCASSVPVYLKALLGQYRAQRIHARDRVRRCAAESGPFLEQALKSGPPRAQPLFASELSLVAPERAVAAIIPLLDTRDVERRRLLRVALARAAAAPRARSAVQGVLKDGTLGENFALELLRALGPRASDFLPEASRVFARLASTRAPFRTRYLLLEPAGILAARDAGARQFVQQSLLRDESPAVRTQAARVITDTEPFREQLLSALRDPNVRVREAGLQTIGERGGQFAAEQVMVLLSADRWPLVRGAAAEAMGALGPSVRLDDALRRAFADPSAHVRAPAIQALGGRGAIRHAPAIRDKLQDTEEAPEVRLTAALALGLLCDTGSLDLLTSHALKLKDPMLGGDERALGTVALASLSRIHPRDLANRVAPLQGSSSAPWARRAAVAAVRSPGSCGGRVPASKRR